MTLGKATLLTGGLVAMFALGVASGPTIHDSWSNTSRAESTVATPAATPADVDTVSPAAPVRTSRPVPRDRAAARASESATVKKPDGAIQTVAVSLWEPQLRTRVKRVLNQGSQLDLAAADFGS